jgi:sugar-specific transcriptional regulator TrmB
MIEQTLKKLGMTDNEIKLYLALLSSGPVASGEIIKKTEFQSSVVFHLLDKLIDKGFVGYVSENKKKIYSAANPSIFKGLIQEKEEELKKIKTELDKEIINLEKEQSKEKEETNITVLKGAKGIQNIFNDMLNNSKEFWTYSRREDFGKIMPKYREYFKEMMIAKKIKHKAIITDEKIQKSYPNQEQRYFPKEYATPIGIELYNDKVLIIIWDAEPPIAIVLEGEKISKSFKSMYKSMWNQAKK